MQGDAASLHRLAVILLDNAIKYAGTGGAVTLRLATAGSQAVLTVHNTGTPIPPDRLPHIFECFYRADPSHTGSGTGLGLAIAKGFAESQHAHFTIQTDGDFFKVIVIFNRRALEDLKPKPAETVKLDMPQAPLIDISKNNENKKD